MSFKLARCVCFWLGRLGLETSVLAKHHHMEFVVSFAVSARKG